MLRSSISAQPVAPGLQRRVEVPQRHLGEEAERAQVHAEQRDPRVREGARSRQQSAVPAKDDCQFRIALVERGARHAVLAQVCGALPVEHGSPATRSASQARSSGRMVASSGFCGLEMMAAKGIATSLPLKWL